jgi:hypothetical protein
VNKSSELWAATGATPVTEENIDKSAAIISRIKKPKIRLVPPFAGITAPRPKRE